MLGLLLLLAVVQPADGWRRVQPGVGDVSTLAVDSRLQPLPLRQDSAFENVYRFDPAVRLIGGGRPSTGDERFARRAGAITAFFPASQYVTVGGVGVPVVPAGTHFTIGEPPVGQRPPAPITPGIAKASADFSASPAPASVREQPPPPRPRGDSERPARHAPESIWTNEAVRVARFERLLDRAMGPPRR